MEFKFLAKDSISRLPKSAGVYAFKKGREFLYIGKAANLRERVKNHFSRPAYRDNLFISQVKKVGWVPTDSEVDALILETNLIKKYRPRYNVVWKDDKNYFFVGVTKEDFPQVFWTHQTKLKTKHYKLKAEYIGPFVDGKALKQTLKVLRKIFPYRSCRQIPNRSCLWHHLNRCAAPCLLNISACGGRTSANLGEKMKKECQRNAENLMKILKKGKNPLLKELTKKMKKVSKNQNFEEAAKIRNQIEALEKVMSHAKIFSEREALGEPMPWQKHCKGWGKTEKKLKRILGIKKKISRIEAYDVSNIQGQNATGSMVTFIKGAPDKNLYRRFKIKISGRPDDVAMLKEVLTRRFCHAEWGWPDLILIDGGVGQLSAALKCKMRNAKCKTIKAVSLAKKENKLYIEERQKPILLKTLPAEIFNLILQLRDEAHRFAVSYHKKLRETNLFKQIYQREKPRPQNASGLKR